MNVVDASVVIAASADDDAHRIWAVNALGSKAAAPHLMPVEVAHVLRRFEFRDLIVGAAGAKVLQDALDFDVDLWPFAPFAGRVWELRGSLTPYDAWYVALAETLDVPLATLDLRLAAASGPRCAFTTPFD